MTSEGWTRESIRAKLAERRAARGQESPAAPASEAPSSIEPFRNSAALVTTFDPETLPGWPPVDRPEGLLDALRPECLVVLDENGDSSWTLRPECRRFALQTLQERGQLQEAFEALPKSARPASRLQRAYELVLTGRWDYIHFSTEDDLVAAIQSVEWLSGIVSRLPDPAELRRRLGKTRLLAPFERLLASGFYGRTRELQDLRDFVGVVDISAAETVLQKVRTKDGYLVLHGPGGAGKSTLIAKFILEHVSSSLAERRFPILYFDLDDAVLRISHADTLLREALRQLALQYPEISQHLEPEEPPSDRVDPQTGFSPRFLWAVERIASVLTERIIPAVRKATKSAGELPVFLMVFDTFEEAVYRNANVERQTTHLLQRLSAVYPTLRPVIAGRALETACPMLVKRAFKGITLVGFDEDAAVGFLASRGVTDPEIARAVAKQLNGNPLSLHLAAEAMRVGDSADTKGLSGIKTNNYRLFKVSEEVIQGQLFRRILAHIKNPDVRKLAHPGLALRRITPELIVHVLAEPCKLNLPDGEEEKLAAANQLFQQLKREVSLVIPSMGNAVRHRTDVRQVMLNLLRQERPDDFREINRRAAEYYSKLKNPTAEDRAEEIYHRLQIGQSATEVDHLFRSADQSFLDNALPELPPRGQLYLASKLGLPLPNAEQLLADASLEEWELVTYNTALNFWQRGDAESAQKILKDRSERSPSSPLYSLEATFQEELGNMEEALKILDRGIKAAAQAGDRLQSARLLGMSGILHFRIGDPLSADAATAEAERLARDLGEVRYLITLLLLREEMARGEGFEPQAAELAARLAAVLGGLSDDEFVSYGDWLRPAIRVASRAMPVLLIRGLDILGLPSNARALANQENTQSRKRELIDYLWEHATDRKAVAEVAAEFAPGPEVSTDESRRNDLDHGMENMEALPL